MKNTFFLILFTAVLLRGFYAGSTQLMASTLEAVEIPTSSLNIESAGKPVVVNLKVLNNVLKFDKKEFTVKAGQQVVIHLENPDIMQHNLIITTPGSMNKVGMAADRMLKDPKAADKFYVPSVPEVLFFTKIVNSKETITLKFTAPKEPGDYPFMCTLPGHWRIMNGVMVK